MACSVVYDNETGRLTELSNDDIEFDGNSAEAF